MAFRRMFDLKKSSVKIRKKARKTTTVNLGFGKD
jgi:hypothetical protein